MAINARVEAVAASASHAFSKPVCKEIRLIAGLGVQGDAHQGEMVKHRSRVRANPHQSNLRQVHLIHAELLDELAAKGFAVRPGDIGENVMTRGIDLLALSRGALLHLGDSAVVEVTGLRNPCHQLDDFMPGLMQAVLGRDAEGGLVLKAGIMTVVRAGGVVRPGDTIRITLPTGPHVRLERV